MTDSPTLVADALPLRRVVFMPWRWRQSTRRAIVLMAWIWSIVYVLSYPVVDTWLITRVVKPIALQSVLVHLYQPLNFATRNSDACFALYHREIDLIQQSPTWSWLLPKPQPLPNGLLDDADIEWFIAPASQASDSVGTVARP